MEEVQRAAVAGMDSLLNPAHRWLLQRIEISDSVALFDAYEAGLGAWALTVSSLP
jgi:hypothetical protein